MSNERKKLSPAQELALISQVDRVCPLDAEPLFYKRGASSFKNYEIAHLITRLVDKETLERMGATPSDSMEKRKETKP